MKYFAKAEFLKHLNLQICKYWYTLAVGKKTETRMTQPNENL